MRIPSRTACLLTFLVCGTSYAGQTLAEGEGRPVSFVNISDGVTLVGTLVLPRGPGPFPSAVLVAGTGPQNRDESYSDHHPFAEIAGYLAERGVATLRYDKRGVGSSSGNFAIATTLDFERDALAGVEYLEGLSLIRRDETGIIGHSEGGLIACMAAAASPKVDFIVLMAGPGLPPEQRSTEQAVRIARAKGADLKVIETIREMAGKMFPIVLGDEAILVKKERLNRTVDDGLSSLNSVEREALIASLGDLELLKKQLLTPWYRTLLGLDPRGFLLKVKCPVLALEGEKDLQEGGQENLTAIGRALKQGGNRDYQLESFPGLNHMFLPSKTGLLEYKAGKDGTIPLEVLRSICGWILKRAKTF